MIASGAASLKSASILRFKIFPLLAACFLVTIIFVVFAYNPNALIAFREYPILKYLTF